MARHPRDAPASTKVLRETWGAAVLPGGGRIKVVPLRLFHTHPYRRGELFGPAQVSRLGSWARVMAVLSLIFVPSGIATLVSPSAVGAGWSVMIFTAGAETVFGAMAAALVWFSMRYQDASAFMYIPPGLDPEPSISTRILAAAVRAGLTIDGRTAVLPRGHYLFDHDTSVWIYPPRRGLPGAIGVRTKRLENAPVWRAFLGHLVEAFETAPVTRVASLARPEGFHPNDPK